jgi:hypothetical protein
MNTAEQFRDDLQTELEDLLDRVGDVYRQLDFGPELNEDDLAILERIGHVRNLLDVAASII